jgi:hypothetical protein
MSTIDADTIADPQAEFRSRLAEAIGKRKQVEKTLASLTQEQDTAHQQLRHAESKLSDANDAAPRPR